MSTAGFEQLHNFRDVGGCSTASGQKLRRGSLFRSAELHRATAPDLERLSQLKLALICDLRSPRESRRKQPRRWLAPAPRLANVSLHDPALHDAGQRRRLLGFLWGEDGVERLHTFCREYYRHLAFDQAAQLGKAITLLAQPENQPALIHCTAGKDRTGLLVALIQLLLGVPFATVEAEYLRTNDDTGPRLERLLTSLRLPALAPELCERMRLIVTTYPEHLREVCDRIVTLHGSVEAYLRGPGGLSERSVQQLRPRLLE